MFGRALERPDLRRSAVLSKKIPRKYRGQAHKKLCATGQLQRLTTGLHALATLHRTSVDLLEQADKRAHKGTMLCEADNLGARSVTVISEYCEI